jgi:hypothetical protein
VHLTPEGRQLLTRAKAFWDGAQAHFLRRFGEPEWKRVEDDLRAIAPYSETGTNSEFNRRPCSAYTRYASSFDMPARLVDYR